jgi:hypothetical protein
MEQRIEKLEIDVAAIKVDVATILLNYATKADIATLRSDMYKAIADMHKAMQKWMIATLIALFIGFGGLFITMSNAVKPFGPAMPSAPVIITIPVPAVAPPG